MGYVEQNLMPDEQIEYQAQLHWIVYAPGAILLLLAIVFFVVGAANDDASFATGMGVCFLLVGALGLAATHIKKTSSEFAVTNRRVLIKVGLLSRHTLELLLQKVEGIGVDQPLIGRLFGFGTIIVTGTGGTKERFNQISAPLEFRRHVQSHATSSAGREAPRAAPLSAAGPFCTKCGTRNAAESRFCSKCGQQLSN